MENPKRLNQSRESEMYETLEITCCLRAVMTVKFILAPNPIRYCVWLVHGESLSHPGVLTFQVWAYKLADKFKSASRHAKVLFPPVVQIPFVQKSMKPILWSRKRPSSSTLANDDSTYS